jgi:putative transposase
MDEDTRRAIALFRFGVLGPLVSARLEHGDRREHFEAAARRDYVTPAGRVVRFSARTLEAWYYRYRASGLWGLAPRSRGDAGTSRSMSAPVRDLVVRAKREKPRRSLRRIIRMLERAGLVRPGELTRSSVHRLLLREGISSRPTRAEDALGHAGA